MSQVAAESLLNYMTFFLNGLAEVYSFMKPVIKITNCTMLQSAHLEIDVIDD